MSCPRRRSDVAMQRAVHHFASRDLHGGVRRVQVVAIDAPGRARATSPRPTVYVLDGQNVFDSGPTAGSSGWKIHRAAQRLVASGRLPPLLLVAIDHGGAHRPEDFTFDAWRGRGGNAAAFARLLAQKIVPFVEAHHATLATPSGRVLIGASLGGLFALHLATTTDCPFGTVAALSPSTFWADHAVSRRIQALTHRTGVRIWIDVGDREAPLLRRSVAAAVESLRQKGWQEHARAAKASLKFVLAKRAAHGERSWSSRMARVLRFALPKTTSKRRQRAPTRHANEGAGRAP